MTIYLAFVCKWVNDMSSKQATDVLPLLCTAVIFIAIRNNPNTSMQWDFSKLFYFGPALALAGADGSFTVDFSVNGVWVWTTQQSPVTVRSRRGVGAVLCLLREGCMRGCALFKLIGSPDDFRDEAGQEHCSRMRPYSS